MADTPLTPTAGGLTIPAGNTSPTGAVVLNSGLAALVKPLGALGAGK